MISAPTLPRPVLRGLARTEESTDAYLAGEAILAALLAGADLARIRPLLRLGDLLGVVVALDPELPENSWALVPPPEPIS